MTRDNGKKRDIDHWETVEVLHSDSVELDRAIIGIVIEVRRPVFEGGAEGFPRMSCTIKRQDRQGAGRERDLRLLCYDGNPEEVQAMAGLFHDMSKGGFGDFMDRYREIADAHRRAHERPRERSNGGGDRREIGGVGGGLSFGRSGKTERMRRKKEKRRRDDQ